MVYLEKGIKIYNCDQWQFLVPPELSDLTPRPDLGIAYQETFPQVSFDQYVIIDGNVLLQDCTPGNETINSRIKKEIQETLNQPDALVTFQIIDCFQASLRLLELLESVNLKTTLVVYPGNGALSVKNYLKPLVAKQPNSIEVPTTRLRTAKKDFLVKVGILKQPPGQFTQILVIDDVVASGQTATEVAEVLQERFGNTINLSLATWFMLSRAEISPLYTSVYSAFIGQPNLVRRPAINSLSCLLSDNAKYDETKLEYGNKYLKSGQILGQLAQVIKGAQNK